MSGVYWSFHTILAVLWAICSFSLIAIAESVLIDDFTLPYMNQIGGVRNGKGVQVVLTYPRHGIIIPNSGATLFETLCPPQEYQNLNGKALRIDYTAFVSGNRTIKYMEYKPGFSKGYFITFQFNVPIGQTGRNHIIVPLFQIFGAGLSMGHAFGIGGPLVVHRLELVDFALESANNVVVSESHQSVVRVQFLNLYAFSSHRSESPNQPSVHKYIHNDGAIRNRNLNSLKLPREGVGITKVNNGIAISPTGYLYEDLVQGSDIIDLTGKRLQIIYTSHFSATITVKVLYNMYFGGFGTVASSTQVVLHSGHGLTVEIRVSEIPNVLLREGKSIWISGPIIVHRIELVNLQVEPNLHEDSFAEQVEEIQLIDDLTTWPYEELNVHNSNHVLDSIRNFPATCRNNCNLPCGGGGESLADFGIQLSEYGYVFEQIAVLGSTLNLTGAQLEIMYSADHHVTRRVELLNVRSLLTGNLNVCPDIIDIHFGVARIGTVRVDLSDCGPSNAIHITGRGEVILHRVLLRIVLSEHPNIYNTILVDDFLDWPLIDSTGISSAPLPNPRVTGHSEPIVFDYSEQRLGQFTPAAHNAIFLSEQGIKILDRGYISQSVPPSKAKSIKIKYSSEYLSTRKVQIVYMAEVNRREGRLHEKTMHVMFNLGHGKEVVFPLDILSSGHFTLMAIRIYGPLSLQQVQVHDIHVPVDLAPGQSAADALLIDDFSDWEGNRYLNRLNSGRDAVGTIGIGYITLSGWDEYLVEYFTHYSNSATLKSLAIRVSYTAVYSTTCKMMLVPDYWNGPNTTISYPADTLKFKDITFNYGTHTAEIPLWIFIGRSSRRTYKFYGILIHGPLNQTLTLHRIELSSAPLYEERIQPKQIWSTGPKNTDSSAVKLIYIEREMTALRINDPPLELPIRRDKIWLDAYAILLLDSSLLRRKLKIKFVEEGGQDLGGLAREFFSLLENEISNPNYALFTTTPEANYALQINPNSAIQGESYLRYYEFIGRLIGMAILNQKLLGIRLAPSLYKKIINEPANAMYELPELIENDTSDVDISDLKVIDEELYTHLCWLLNNNVADIGYEMTMTVESPDLYGGKTTVNLIKDGGQHKVTEANKKQYVREYAKWHVERKVEEQANALRTGVYDVLPEGILSAFSSAELEVLIAGKSEIDVDDWIANTAYLNDFSETHQAIQWFWQCVRKWDNSTRSKLLQFVTGCPRVPSTGFAGLEHKFTISQANPLHVYPSSSTCTSNLKLPPFSDGETMCNRLLSAIQPETCSGFGYA